VFALIKNGAFMAIVAHGLIGISLLWDKVLLKRCSAMSSGSAR